MIRLSITVICLFVLAGVFIGWRVPHVLERQAERELGERPDGGLCCISSAIDYSAADESSYDSLGNLLKNIAELNETWLDDTVERLVRPSEAALKRMKEHELYVRAGLPEKYQQYLYSVGSNLGRRHYRAARSAARKAIEIRCSAQYHDADYEERFADNLVGLGLYVPAGDVLESLTVLDESSGVTVRTSSREYRMDTILLAELALGKFKAVQSKLVTQRSDHATNPSGMEYFQACAYLGLCDNAQARKLFSGLNALQNADHAQLEEYLAITKLGADDHDGAMAIATRLEAVWEQLQRRGVCCPDRMPETDFAANCMRVRGHQAAAEELHRFAERVEAQ